MATKPCKVCGVVNGHRIGCRRSMARAALIKAVIEWHHVSHRGEFETCSERECYACHPSVLPG